MARCHRCRATVATPQPAPGSCPGGSRAMDNKSAIASTASPPEPDLKHDVSIGCPATARRFTGREHLNCTLYFSSLHILKAFFKLCKFTWLAKNWQRQTLFLHVYDRIFWRLVRIKSIVKMLSTVQTCELIFQTDLQECWMISLSGLTV